MKSNAWISALSISLAGGLTLTAGCGSPPTWTDDPDSRAPTAVIDLSNYGNFSIEGLSADPETGRIYAFLPGRGILMLDAEGEAEDAIASGAAPELQSFVGDLTLLPSGDYVLQNSSEVYRLSAETLEREETYDLSSPNEAADWRSIDALGYDHAGEAVLCLSTDWDWDDPSQDGRVSSQVTWLSAEGEAFEEVALAPVDELFIEGIARHPTEDLLLGVDQGWLMLFDLDGTPLVRFTLDEVSDATSLDVDAERGRILVADRTDLEIVTFDLDDLSF